MNELPSSHYDEGYFRWQRPLGEFGGWANLTKFDAFVREDDAVLDFGCGGGFLLANIRCAKKYGVEINDAAARIAESNGIEVHKTLDGIPDESVDLAISDNALEHTMDPLGELRKLIVKIRPGGRCVFVVPCETIAMGYRPGNMDRHLYSWSPMNLGNMFAEAGFDVVAVEPYVHKWPPGYEIIARLGGRRLFELCCRVYGHFERTWFQVRLNAVKPS